MSVPRLSAPARVWLLTFALTAAGAGALPFVAHDAPVVLGGPSIEWWVLAVGFGLAEIFVMHLRIARHAHSFSLSELPLVVGLLLVVPVDIVLAQAVGVAIVLAVHRHQKPIRLGFNIAQRSFTAVVAIAVFASVAGAFDRGWTGIWIGAFSAMLVADVVAAVLINAAISLSEGTWMLFDQVVGIGTALTLANTALGLVAVMVIREEPAAIILVALPAATTFLAGKAYADIHRKHDDMVLLQRSTRLAQGSLQLEEMLPPLLAHVREMFRADIAEIALSSDDEGAHLVSRIGAGDARSLMRPTVLDPREGVWARMAAEREPIVLPRPIRNEILARFFGSQGIVDAVVVPIQSDGELIGTMMVANRIGDFSSFDDGDAELATTLANHVAVAIRNTQLVRRLEESLAHETEVSRLKDDFVATVSHELRTPLTSVKGYIKTLLSPDVELTPSERREFLQRADRASERLRTMIEDLLFASRVEASRMTATDAIVSLPAVAERLLEERAAALDEPDRLALDIAESPCVARTDEGHVYRVLGNLVDNALKYSSGVVTVSVSEDGNGTRVSVRDRGPGIPPVEHDRIFERFYQVDQSLTRDVGGAGMGLYICRKVAEGLGGRVWLERSDASGTEFCLWVPFERRRSADGGQLVSIVA